MNFLPPCLTELRREWAPSQELLEQFCAVLPAWDRPAVESLRVRIHRGALEAYTAGRGLVLLEVIKWTHENELSIYGMVGRDIIPRWKAVLEDLKLLAEYKGCKLLGGNGIPKGWQRVGVMTGFTPLSIHYVMELDNGR